MITYNLTNQQKNILDIIKIYGKSIYNISGAVIYDELYDYNVINQAINNFLYRNDGYRIRIIREKGQDRQYIKEHIEEKFEIKEFENKFEFEKFAEEESKTPINIYENKLYKFYIIKIGNVSGVLAIASHIITDGMSYALLCKEVKDSIQDIISGRELSLYKYSYINHIVDEEKYNNSDKFISDGVYWKKQFNKDVNKNLIKANITHSSLKSNRIRIISNSVHSQLIKKICYDNEISEAVLFETAFIIYLKSINRDKDNIIIGVPMLNRKNRYERNTAGLFQSTLPMVINISLYREISEIFSAVKAKHREIFKHTRYPVDKINSFIKEKGLKSVYEVLVSFQNSNVGNNEFETLWFGNGYNEIPLSFHIDCRDSKKEYAINIDYNNEIFDELEVRLVYDRIMYIIEQMATKSLVEDIKILPEKEKMLLKSFNNTHSGFDRQLTVYKAIKNSINKYGEKTAFVFNDIKYSYKQLDKMSNALARELKNKNVSNNDIVAILTGKNQYTIIAMVAVIKAGGAYVFIDNNYPKERIDYIINECSCKAVITLGENLKYTNSINIENFDFEKNVDNIENNNSPDDLCYINYTSGSTGNPKGIAVKNIGVINFSLPINNNLTVMEAVEKGYNKIISVTSGVFDIFAFETLTALINGWTIYVLNDQQSSDTKFVADIIKKYSIDILQTTPTKMKLYTNETYDVEYLKNLKLIILIGEVFSDVLYNRIRQFTDCSVYNNYGPAETTVWSTNSLVKEKVNIGKPIANTSVYILDECNNTVPIGIDGEICIGGLGVSKGYINNEEENIKRFVKLSENNIIYKTGDRGCYKSDGSIIYLDRIDTMVKIRGLRVELGEIENIVSQYSGIELSAVIYKRTDSDREYIICYYTAYQSVDEEKLRLYIASKLPQYMVPNYFMKLDSMPVTPSGKLDRNRLPEFSFEKSRLIIEPETENEKILCDIFKEVLEIDEIGVNENFMELGGDSLLALKMIALAESKGLDIPYYILYEAQNIREICNRIG